MHNRFFRFYILLLLLSVCSAALKAQIAMPGSGRQTGLGQQTPVPAKPNEYEIGGITVSGNRYLDEDLLMAVTGLKIGDKLQFPNNENIAKAIRNLWKQDLFSDVSIDVTKVIGDKIFLDIKVQERPRLSKYNFKGIKKSETQELKDKVNLVRMRVVTDATKQDAINRIKKYYSDKGFGNVRVQVLEQADSVKSNSVLLTFNIDKGNKTKINQINIVDNTVAADSRLKRTMRGTKEMPRLSLYRADEVKVYKETIYDPKKEGIGINLLHPTQTLETLDPYLRLKGVFSSSKYNDQKFQEDKQSMVDYYNSIGFRDAAVTADTIYPVMNGNLNIDMRVGEGHRYYFGDISWRGNTKYPSDLLSRILGIKRGDVYNAELLNKRLGVQANPDGGEDISSLYMDDGYLFFRIEPREISIIDDTINYEMVISEGPQATIKNITISGNDRTNEHVIRRQLYTYPGQKFSRSNLIRSQREIANLGFFDPEKTGINPTPNVEDGTVDIEYAVAEKSSDQLQLSAGFGGGVRFYGNIGITFNNFSLRNILKPRTWDPLPIGDGQKLSINYQSNAYSYSAFNFAFTEPWLGGRKPNALTVNFIYSKFGQTVSGIPSYLKVLGGGVSLSKRIKWPDDNFVLTYGVNYNYYEVKNYTGLIDGFNNGTSNNLFFKTVLARYSVNQPLYPTGGSNINLTFQFTPPWSALSGKDYSNATIAEKYKLIEYHKYRFTAEWYQKIVGNLVFKFATKYGFLGYYNPQIGFSPFERFQVGGDGLSQNSFFIGRDIIAHRGYEVYANSNATIFNKYTAEVRYPFSLSPTSTIYGLAFYESANSWASFKDFNPFKLNRSAGLGIRLFLPMFGLMGLDYGVGFDRYTPGSSFKDISKFTFMLGFEPD
ncbi:MAG TPA: POTRA domain-containing protein [Flavipsychrobacter sp.]|nr:POTRA domain-containing protein [Flavipsychrobacter sp.]